MPSQAQPLLSILRIIVVRGVTALWIAFVMLAVHAQNSLPPTAVQAARSPQFAKRLAHPAGRPASQPQPVLASQAARRAPGQVIIYDNGPVNGNTDAWAINLGFIVSDTFQVSGNNSTITGMTFGAWLYPGDTLTSADISITSDPNGGTTYFSQTVNFTQGGCTSNQYGFNVCTASAIFSGPTLLPGTYWVNLQNASVPSGDPVYWDENAGVGCHSQGCPSMPSENTLGTILSESFSILGQVNGGTTPEPGSLILFATGVLGLAGVARRKLR
jgi:hypothetical protein